MKKIEILHNPNAGEGKMDKDELVQLLETHGYQCNYHSTKKKGWKDFDVEADIILVAGGDGTIRKAAAVILEKELLDKPLQIGVLPFGTANNIARSLSLDKPVEQIIAGWKNASLKSFDAGRVFGLKGKRFFMESFGYGIFPYLMMEMKKQEAEDLEPEESIRLSLEVLQRVIEDYQPHACRIEVDGKDYSGSFLMAEIMNTPSIGPNLKISPASDPGDGIFEIVLVPGNEKDKLAAYVAAKLNGNEPSYHFPSLTGTDIRISWEGTHVHVDDEVVETLDKGDEVHIRLKKGLLEFLT